MQYPPTALIILDGFGWSESRTNNAIALAHTPTLTTLWNHYPHALLAASGTAVGLPAGTIGNSEVGHTTIGAGRIIPSEFLSFEQSIASGDFFTQPALRENLELLKTTGKRLHIMGLLSLGGVQCHTSIINALLEAAKHTRISSIILHLFLDGRDMPPRSAAPLLQALDAAIATLYPHAHIGSITGRFFALDRDENWDRTDATYRMLTTAQQPQHTHWQDALSNAYARGISDEFVPPTLLHADGIIQEGDGVIFANFRPDRARQLTRCFLFPALQGFTHAPTLLFFITATRYSPNFNNPVLLEKIPVSHTLKEVLSTAGKSLFSIAETEKYAHVTYFFSDGQEQPFAHETRQLIPSLKRTTYADTPTMSAPAITKAVRASLAHKPCDFYLINYANADMVGHSGNLAATIQAVECLDAQLKQLYDEFVVKRKGTLYITADHGNAEMKYDEATQQPWTAHTTNPVPFIWVNQNAYNISSPLRPEGLADIAPFILRNMGIAVPREMQR